MYRWVAQISDTSNDLFADFINQLPTTLIMSVCGAGLLLFIALIYFAYIKPRRNRKPPEQPAPTQTNNPIPDPPERKEEPPMVKNTTPDDDMPDLDLLIDRNSLEKELPPVDPASIPKKSAPAATHSPANTTPPVRSNRRTYRVSLSTGGLARAEELLSVLRDERDGRLMVQINDKAYRSLTEDPEAKAQFIQLMRELNDTVSKEDDNPPTEEDLEAVVEDFAAPPPPIDATGGMPGDLPRYTLEESMRPTRTGRYESTPMPELNIAQAIESYLQHKLKYTSGFEGRQLHVLSAPGGGVRIQVDDRFFEAVGDVDEPDVREFLSATIQEWQARQG